MGASASVDSAPFPSEVDALAAGKTQQEINAFLKLNGKDVIVEVQDKEKEPNPTFKPQKSRRRKSTASELLYPQYVIRVKDFLQLELLRSHGKLVDAGLVEIYDDEVHGSINFLSHQWLSRNHPDPDGTQLRSIQSLFHEAINGGDPFKSTKDWTLYSERWDYKLDKLEAMKTNIDPKASIAENPASSTHSSPTKHPSISKKKVATLADFRKSIENGCVWIDYISIPQICDIVQEDRGSKDIFWHEQNCAIQSIPGYVEKATNFWVVAPPCVHRDNGILCDLSTWRMRGWCRMEDWINELSVRAHRPLIINSTDNKVVCEDFTDKMTHRALPRHAVLLGEFTCCKMNHKLDSDGSTMPCDKEIIGPVLERVYDFKLQHLKRTKDLVNFAWFMCLRPSILASHESGNYILSKETSSGFLTRYGWSGQNPEGADASDQTVFFPLFCAATEGNLPIVNDLLAAGADVNRRLLGVGTSSLEAAALCGHIEVCTALLDAGANLEGCSQFDNATALIKAAKGGAAEVVKLLLKRGANASHTNQAGETPLAIAESEAHEDVCAVLRAHRGIASETR